MPERYVDFFKGVGQERILSTSTFQPLGDFTIQKTLGGINNDVCYRENE